MNPRIDILVIGDSGEGRTLRAVAESIGCKVDMTYCGKPSDLFEVRADQPQADLTIISAHGDEGGIIFPEIVPEIDKLELPDNRITSKHIQSHWPRQRTTVLCLACNAGSDAIVSAFQTQGVKTYIASSGEPDGSDAILFAHNFLHACYHRQMNVADAVALCNITDSADGFSLFSDRN